MKYSGSAFNWTRATRQFPLRCWGQWMQKNAYFRLKYTLFSCFLNASNENRAALAVNLLVSRNFPLRSIQIAIRQCTFVWRDRESRSVHKRWTWTVNNSSSHEFESSRLFIWIKLHWTNASFRYVRVQCPIQHWHFDWDLKRCANGELSQLSIRHEFVFVKRYFNYTSSDRWVMVRAPWIRPFI